MKGIYANLRYWLVDHPSVTEFEWKEGETFGASTQFLITTVLTYLSLTAILHFITLPSKSTVQNPSASSTTRFLLRVISAIHNLILEILSFIMAVGCILSTSTQMPNSRWIFCFPPNKTPPRGPVFFWAYIFYLSKTLEFIDTLLILLNRGNKRLTFLHVYHHAIVVVMCYIWLHTSQSLLPVALVTNCLVHTLMYAYYMLCTLGKRPPWKRLVTDCQIVQFVFSFGVSIVMLWFHFTGIGCSGFWGWVFNAGFNASLLALFTDFHNKNYDKKKKSTEKRRD
ncbi:GNS1/SUR4 membrane protein [Macleaya cordata]|uniref:very-long-chain 3-oxoacyl-CoA synthase n=1 Tax=Macleaya cordata TaxID=56857 RepID=A0A200PUY2_MACCD|nr:GNS1/SUR4 membrane protein [Macleaya cordata]